MEHVAADFSPASRHLQALKWCARFKLAAWRAPAVHTDRDTCQQESYACSLAQAPGFDHGPPVASLRDAAVS